ncbi:MAG: M28 family peptidase [Gemmatimonadales bacterium]|nr:M28 family peptidase [Gemmatimonadales bacterium]
MALGWAVEEDRFTFAGSTLKAFPLLGAAVAWLVLLEAPLLHLPGVPAWGAAAVLAPGLLAAALLVAAVGLGWTALGDPPRQDASLIATRPGAAPRRWIVAHLDTKAQGHSLAGRIVAVGVLAAAVLALGVAAAWRASGPLPPMAIAAVSLLGLAASTLAARGGRHGASPGARDNASGIVALLAAARDAGPETGLVVTGAEEFGLVGARLLARRHPARFRGAEVINLDTLDDDGPLSLLAHDRRGGAYARALAPSLASLGLPVRFPLLPPGVLVDSVPFARAGATAVTVARVTWQTLRIVHTPRDTDAGLAFDTAERLGRLLARPGQASRAVVPPPSAD